MTVVYSVNKPTIDMITEDHTMWIRDLSSLKTRFPNVLWYQCLCDTETNEKIRVRKKYYKVDKFIIYPTKNNDYMRVLDVLNNIDTKIIIRTFNIFTKRKMLKYIKENKI